MDNLFKNINGRLSDQQVLMSFCHFYLYSILNEPVTEEGVLEERGISYVQSNYLKNRHKVVFYRLQEDNHYMALRFIETACWLLNHEMEVRLNDGIFRETVKHLSDRLKQKSPLTAEEQKTYSSFVSLSRYASEETHREALKKLEGDCDVLKTYETEIEQSGRGGQHLWGPFYWAFLHRYVYRMEDKMVTLRHAEIGGDRARQISDCFLSFYWFVKFLADFLLCAICSSHYEASPVRPRMMDGVWRHYPRVVLSSSPDRVDEQTFEDNKSPFVQRLMSIEYYLAHAYHTQSLDRKVEYSIVDLFRALS